MIVLSDAQISTYLSEAKVASGSYPAAFTFQTTLGHYRCRLPLSTTSGNNFDVHIRQNVKNPLDFSVILIFHVAGSNQSIRLVRYNGKSHQHTNAIEGNTLPYGFHIHRATERYMRQRGADPEGFAEDTNRYTDLMGAFRCFTADCNIQFAQGNLI